MEKNRGRGERRELERGGRWRRQIQIEREKKVETEAGQKSQTHTEKISRKISRKHVQIIFQPKSKEFFKENIYILHNVNGAYFKNH